MAVTIYGAQRVRTLPAREPGEQSACKVSESASKVRERRQLHRPRNGVGLLLLWPVLDEATLEIRTRHAALLGLAKDAVAVLGDELVRPVTHRCRHERKCRKATPRPIPM